MFDHLVHRAADATLQQSQVKAAREELQKAYIKLAATRSNAHGSSSAHSGESRKHPLNWAQPFASSASSSAGELERTQSNTNASADSIDAGELDRLRRKCAQLESSLQSQGLAHRRLEAELASYHALARDELRLALSSRTASSVAPATSVTPAPSTVISAQASSQVIA